jgi:hypothetical protein
MASRDIDPKTRARLALTLVSGARTAPELAREYGVSEAELLRWESEVLDAASRPAPRSRALWAAAALAVVCLGAGAALSQAAAFPIVLRTFTANTPAVASEVNANFTALKSAADNLKSTADALRTSLDAKLGSVTSTDLTVPGASTLRGPVVANAGLLVNGGFNTSSAAVAGAATVGGPLTVNGDINVTGNVTGPRQIVTATYNASFAAQSTASALTAVPQDRLATLCSDEDGCLLRLIMEDWNTADTDASIGPIHFAYNTSSRGYRTANQTATDPASLILFSDGVDNDNTYEIVLRAWNCYFIDGRFPVGTNTGVDNQVGFYLLNFNAELSYKPRCKLIIDD